MIYTTDRMMTFILKKQMSCGQLTVKCIRILLVDIRENEWKRGFKLNLKQDQRHRVEESHPQF